MTDEHLHDTIEKYLLGELPPLDAARLESEMKTDRSLFEQVELHRLGLMGLQRLAAADLREKFAKWDEEMDTESVPKPSKHNAWVWATGVLLLLLAVGAFWHFQQSKKMREAEEREKQRDALIAVLQNDSQQKQAELNALLVKSKTGKDSLAQLEIKHLQAELDRVEKALRELENPRTKKGQPIAMNFAPKANDVDGMRRGFDDGDSTCIAAAKAYKAKNYTDAIRLLKSIPANDERQEQVEQLMPYALFYANDFRAAIPAFLNLWEHDKFVDKERIQWYLILCYVGEGKETEVRQGLLNILQNPKHKYFEDAKKLKAALQNVH